MDNTPENEVEKLLPSLLKGTPFEGRVKIVGGYVRDEVLARVRNTPFIAKDLDILVTGGPGQAEKCANFIHELLALTTSTPRSMGKGYPIWQLVFFKEISGYQTRGAIVEFSDTMKETYPDPDSRQREVSYASLEEDIKRRDFTSNMLLKDATTGDLEDLTGVSLQDIKNGVLRAHPEVSEDKMFTEDPLRMLRLVRFHSVLGWKPTEELKAAAVRNASRINIISKERIYGEFVKIAEHGSLSKAIVLMKDISLLSHILPEIQDLYGVGQNKHHLEGCVYTHTLMVLELAKPGVVHQFAALLHDVGKPRARKEMDGKVTFLKHELYGAEIAEVILRRLKFPKDLAQRIVFLVSNHLRPTTLVSNQVTDKAIRKFIKDMGVHLDDILDLEEADGKGKVPVSDFIPCLRERIFEVSKKDAATTNGDAGKRVVTGRDVMEHLSIPPGPKVGRALALASDIMDSCLDRGIKPTKELVLSDLKKMISV